jgi:hypothetical protein
MSFTTIDLTGEQINEALERGLTSARVTYGTEPHENPNNGDLWVNSVSGILKVYFNTWTTVVTVVNETADVQVSSSAPQSGKLWINSENWHVYAFKDPEWIRVS